MVVRSTRLPTSGAIAANRSWSAAAGIRGSTDRPPRERAAETSAAPSISTTRPVRSRRRCAVARVGRDEPRGHRRPDPACGVNFQVDCPAAERFQGDEEHHARCRSPTASTKRRADAVSRPPLSKPGTPSRSRPSTASHSRRSPALRHAIRAGQPAQVARQDARLLSYCASSGGPRSIRNRIATRSSTTSGSQPARRVFATPRRTGQPGHSWATRTQRRGIQHDRARTTADARADRTAAPLRAVACGTARTPATRGSELPIRCEDHVGELRRHRAVVRRSPRVTARRHRTGDGGASSFRPRSRASRNVSVAVGYGRTGGNSRPGLA